MITDPALLPTIFQGWQDYQILLVSALRPLSAEQLALRYAPKLRSIGMIATHMIGARARWFYLGFRGRRRGLQGAGQLGPARPAGAQRRRAGQRARAHLGWDARCHRSLDA